MLGEILQRKLDFLRSPKHEAVARTLALTFQAAARPLRQESVLAPAVFRQLEIELIYTLIKNAPWHLAPVFKDTVIDFLKSDYRLTSAVASTLVTPLLARLAEMAAQRAAQGDTRRDSNQRLTVDAVNCDKDFLRYVFVTTAAAEDEDALLSDLGFGRSILTRIRQGVASACRVPDANRPGRSPSKSVAEIVFVPEIDALFSELMLDISRAAKDRPWITDIYRLRYDLLALPEPWQTMLAEDGVDWLFDLLLTIGTRGSLLQPEIDAALATSLPTYALSAKAGKQLMAALNDAELVMGLGGGQMPDPTIPRWRLLSKAESITASAFAHAFCRDHQDPDAADLIRLAPSYQDCIIRVLADGVKSRLLQDIALAQPKALSPLALGSTLRQILRLFAPDMAEALLLQSLIRHKTPWHRTVILENMRGFSSFAVAQALDQVAQSDPSATVREAAEAELFLRQTNRAETGLLHFDGQPSRQT